MATVVYAVLFYAATFALVGGLGLRSWQYATTPAPLRIPTTPAPTTRICIDQTCSEFFPARLAVLEHFQA